MVITVKKKKQELLEEKEAMDIIMRGGKTVQESLEEESNDHARLKTVNLRIPEELLNEVDHLVKKRKRKTTRTNWILDAIEHYAAYTQKQKE